MAISNTLKQRCEGICEMCGNEAATQAYAVSPETDELPENCVAIGENCISALENISDNDHWRCLEGSIWHPERSVQALSYRLLKTLEKEAWADNILSSVALDESVIDWAMSAFQSEEKHKDAYGNLLESGDTVVLTQALNVKGTNFSAPKGTIVKKIRLVQDNPEQIEGKINEQVIVILTKYVKKG